MKKFTVITKDGSKWLSRTAPHGVDPIQWHSDNLDLPYIGSAEPGTSLSEEQVKEIRQFMIGGTIDWDNTITEQGDWITMHDIDRGKIEADLPDFLKRTAYVDAESHDRHISGWTHVSEALPEHLETVWLSNGKGFTTLGCLVWSEDGWHWAVTNGVIYEENSRIVSECESDDIDAEYWHRLPDALRIDKEVKP